MFDLVQPGRARSCPAWPDLNGRGLALALAWTGSDLVGSRT